MLLIWRFLFHYLDQSEFLIDFASSKHQSKNYSRFKSFQKNKKITKGITYVQQNLFQIRYYLLLPTIKATFFCEKQTYPNIAWPENIPHTFFSLAYKNSTVYAFVVVFLYSCQTNQRHLLFSLVGQVSHRTPVSAHLVIAREGTWI